MAKFTPSSIVSEVRGSIKDVTFSRNRSGAIITGKGIHPVSSTPDQVARRDAMAAGVLAWQGLSEEEFQQWENFARSQSKHVTPGKSISLAAYNLFTARYVNRSVVDGVNSGFGPLPCVRMTPIIESVETDANEINVNWLTLFLRSDCDFAIYATAPMSPGRRSLSPSDYKFLTYFTPGAPAGTLNIYSDYDTRYTLTSADNGKRVGVAIKAINTDNYAASLFSYHSGILIGIV